jgi:hypothetical protein
VAGYSFLPKSISVVERLFGTLFFMGVKSTYLIACGHGQLQSGANIQFIFVGWH